MAAISLSIDFHSQRLLKKQTFHNDSKNDDDDEDEVAVLWMFQISVTVRYQGNFLRSLFIQLMIFMAS